MAKKPPKKTEDEPDIEVQSWQWETPSKRLTLKQCLIIISLIAVGILFVFGFLIVGIVVLILTIIVNIVLFILKKL